MPKFPLDLESQYSKQIVKFIKSVNKEYSLFIRQLLKDKEFQNKLNSFEIRFNVFNFQKFRKKLLSLRDRIFKKKTFENVFKSMSRVFRRLDKRVIDNIKKSVKTNIFRRVLRKKDFEIPSIEFQDPFLKTQKQRTAKSFFGDFSNVFDEAIKKPSEGLETAIERNVALIQGIVEKNVDNLEASVLNAIEAGSDFDIIVKEVQKQSEKSEAYAKFVARDQLNKAYGSINKERQESAGFDKYKWQATTGDWSNVRQTHKDVHGEIYSWSKPPLVGDRNLHPGEDYNCRCIAIPVFEDE